MSVYDCCRATEAAAWEAVSLRVSAAAVTRLWVCRGSYRDAASGLGHVRLANDRELQRKWDALLLVGADVVYSSVHVCCAVLLHAQHLWRARQARAVLFSALAIWRQSERLVYYLLHCQRWGYVGFLVPFAAELYYHAVCDS